MLLIAVTTTRIKDNERVVWDILSITATSMTKVIDDLGRPYAMGFRPSRWLAEAS